MCWYQARRAHARYTSPAYIRVSRICSSCPAPAHGLPPRSTGQWLAGLGFAPIYSGAASRALRRSVRPLPFAIRRVHLFSAYNASPHFVRLFVPSFVRVTLAESTLVRRFGDFNARQLLFSYLSISLSPSLFLSISVSFHPSVPAPTSSGHPRAPLFSAARPFLVPNPARFHG